MTTRACGQQGSQHTHLAVLTWASCVSDRCDDLPRGGINCATQAGQFLGCPYTVAKTLTIDGTARRAMPTTTTVRAGSAC